MQFVGDDDTRRAEIQSELNVHNCVTLYCCSRLAFHFQENLLRTMVQIENTYFDLGCTGRQNCLIICDRGTMDASACKCAVR